MEPETINATRLRIDTRDLMEQVKFNGQRFIVQTFGRPMAVIISFEDYLRVKEHLMDLKESPIVAVARTGEAKNPRRKNK